MKIKSKSNNFFGFIILNFTISHYFSVGLILLGVVALIAADQVRTFIYIFSMRGFVTIALLHTYFIQPTQMTLIFPSIPQQCSSGSSKVPAFPQDPSCFITNYYLECNNGVATVKKCPSGYLFDSGECLQFGDCATIDMPCICS